MKRTIAFVLSFTLLLGLFIQVPAAGADNSQSAVNGSSIGTLAALGLFSGNESGDLEPDSAVSREEFAKL